MKQENRKARNYQAGAVKRLLKIKPGEKVETGDFIRKANTMKALSAKQKLAIKVLI